MISYMASVMTASLRRRPTSLSRPLDDHVMPDKPPANSAIFAARHGASRSSRAISAWWRRNGRQWASCMPAHHAGGAPVAGSVRRPRHPCSGLYRSCPLPIRLGERAGRHPRHSPRSAILHRCLSGRSRWRAYDAVSRHTPSSIADGAGSSSVGSFSSKCQHGLEIPVYINVPAMHRGRRRVAEYDRQNGIFEADACGYLFPEPRNRNSRHENVPLAKARQAPQKNAREQFARNCLTARRARSGEHFTRLA